MEHSDDDPVGEGRFEPPAGISPHPSRTPTTSAEQYEYYALETNQEPQGPPTKRRLRSRNDAHPGDSRSDEEGPSDRERE